MGTLKLYDLEKLEEVTTKISKLVKDQKIKEEILKEIFNCSECGCYATKDGIFFAKDFRKINHKLGIKINLNDTEEDVIASINFITRYGKNVQVTKAITYKMYYDDYSTTEEKERIKWEDSTVIKKEQRVFDEYGVEISKRNIALESNEDYRRNINATYYRQDDLIFKIEEKRVDDKKLDKKTRIAKDYYIGYINENDLNIYDTDTYRKVNDLEYEEFFQKTAKLRQIAKCYDKFK